MTSAAIVYPSGTTVTRFAHVSSDGMYRYWLYRSWGDAANPDDRALAFLMLNPSVADGEKDDPTIRRCVGFARRLGFTGITVFNLYAYRATKPRELHQARKAGVDVVGPENDGRLRGLLRTRPADSTIAAWGAHADAARVRKVLDMPGADRLRSLGVTSAGVPRHPLMLGYEGIDLQPVVRP